MTWIDGLAVLLFALGAMGVWMWSLVTDPPFLREWLVWGLFASAAMGVSLFRIDVEPLQAFGGGLFFGFFTTGLTLLRYRLPPWSGFESEQEHQRPRPPLDLDRSPRND